MTESDTNGFDVFVSAARRAREDYAPAYSSAQLDGAVNRARFVLARKRAASRTLRLMTLCALLALVVAGSLIRVPASGISAPSAKMPSEIATVNLWEYALMGSVGWNPATDDRWEEPLGLVQQAYEQHVAGIFARKLMAM